MTQLFPMMKVNVVRRDGAIMTISLDAEATVNDLIEKLKEELDGSSNRELLVKRDSTILANDEKIAALNLDKDEFLQLEFGRRQPMPKRTCLLPRRSDVDVEKIQYPADFEDRINQLEELNFEGMDRDSLKSALTDSFFDVNRAAEYIMARIGEKAPTVRNSGPRYSQEQMKLIQKLRTECNANTMEVVQILASVGWDEELARPLITGE